MTSKRLLSVAVILLAFVSDAFAWSSRASKTLYDLVEIQCFVEIFRAESGHLPDELNVWSDLKSIAGQSVKAWPPVDSWQHPIRYRAPGKHGEFDIYSVGPDGVDNDGESDDVSLWAEVNEGYHWKKTWPLGRATIRYGIALSLGFLLLGFRYRLKFILPLAGAIAAFSIAMGSNLQMHPGIVPSHNTPLAHQNFVAALCLIACAIVFTINLTRHKRIKTA